MSLPSTTEIYKRSCVEGDIRFAKFRTRIVLAIEVPRSCLAEFRQMSESTQAGSYILVGNSATSCVPKLYIGETEDLGERLNKHRGEWDFWNTAFVVVSLTRCFTKAEIKFMEWMSIKAARVTSRCVLMNGNSGARGRLHSALEEEYREIYETANALLGSLAPHIFLPVSTRPRDGAPRRFQDTATKRSEIMSVEFSDRARARPPSQ